VALPYEPCVRTIVEWNQDLGENGSNNFNETAEEFVFVGLHRACSRLLDCNKQDIAVGSSATELLASLAWAVMPSGNIVSTAEAFPSTVYPWSRVAQHTGAEVRLANTSTQAIIEKIDDNTEVVCISHVEYSNGECYNLKLLGEAAHAHGAILVVDATQSAGAIPIDVTESGVDALVAGAYKWLCGPFGAAVMYLNPKLHHLNPGLVGFRSHESMWELQADRVTLPDTAARFEFATMAFGNALGLQKSVEYLNEVGVENVWKHNNALREKLNDGLMVIGADICAVGCPSDGSSMHCSSITTFSMPGKETAPLVDALKQRNIYVSNRGGKIRVSPHLYNTSEDIETLLNALE
jgi:selenocysteine lyase/cysteine desulfurase